MSRISMVSLFALLLTACDDDGGSGGGSVAVGEYDITEHLSGPCGEPSVVTDCLDCRVSAEGPIKVEEQSFGSLGTYLMFSDCRGGSDCIFLASVEKGATSEEAQQQTAFGDGTTCQIRSTDFEVHSTEGGLELLFRTFEGSVSGNCDFEGDESYPTDGFDCAQEEIVRLTPR